MSKKYDLNMTQGPLLKNIIIFAIPLMFTSVLQLLYTSVDMVIVGRFAGSDSLAAVGSTTNITTLLTTLFIGLSSGVSVIVSILYGSKDDEGISKAVHTAIAVSLISGVFASVLGIATCKNLLTLMGVPSDIIDKAALYMRILFLGMPAVMFYNFGSAILRSIGDTKRPFRFLIFSGITNVVGNIFLVAVFRLDVAGVAIATILSQYVSATLLYFALSRSEGSYKLSIKKIHIYKKELFDFIRIGVPFGIQNILFCISNVLIYSALTLFGADAMAGISIATNLEAFAQLVMIAFAQAVVTACGQNLGAKNLKRIKRSILTCILLVTISGLLMALIIFLFKNTLIGFYTTDSKVISFASMRICQLIFWFILCGVMDCATCVMRGLSYSTLPTVVSLVGICGLRILWIATAFQQNKTLETLFWSYPVTWIITTAAHVLCICIALKKLKKQFAKDEILC